MQQLLFLFAMASLYTKHALQCTDGWRNLWDLIQLTIDEQLGQEMELQYENLNKKLDALQAQRHRQNNKPRNVE